MFMKEVMVEIQMIRYDLEDRSGQVQMLMVFKIQWLLMVLADRILQTHLVIQSRLEKEIPMVM